MKPSESLALPLLHHTGDRVVRTAELAERLGISRTTLWRWWNEGHFPPPRTLGRAHDRPIHGWMETEVLAWLSDRPTHGV